MSKKFGLGKGLNALIPSEDIDEVDENSKVYISINKIRANSEQPRKYFDSEKISELSKSILNHGVIQPLILQKDNENYIIVAGERRWRAAKLAGLKEVPAVVMDFSKSQLLEISLIENIQREDLNPIEEAKAFKQLISEFNLTQEALSERVGKSRTTITNSMRLLNLDERVQNYVIEGVLSEGHGRTLLAIDDKEVQYEMAQKVIDDKITVRELEKIIKNLGKEKKKPENVEGEISPYLKDLREKLESHFGTKVNIDKKRSKGKIEIEYYSNEDLERILELINL
ncbi:ParB/RepB/Spo0J family partition protein [Clostridium sp. 'White wine YQ']|uniref:ParB/RepB/Spo0J family partition protein n=1 Tax=Clostridium sp. 'White wine YQ' TaxID=3027474 RepID=UPI0023654E94|nr:ParB/RepB/Spo0J family partition protein [Clostridium sp. 'White wine YQ']MDD7796236.1 ParB/RepB/Spo0J family partition protein [Clostridium sp. 'White wine YQ']